jgi:hypothetical protein
MVKKPGILASHHQYLPITKVFVAMTVKAVNLTYKKHLSYASELF